jgi:serine phosphatase RsbU (regulator of sigma subunit)
MTGLPLGILPEAPMECPPPLVLAPGEAFLVLSDGVFECETGDGRELGLGPAIEAARRHLAGGARQTIRSIRDLTESVCRDGKFRDDRTIVVARRTG